MASAKGESGQIISYDLLIGTLIFLVVLGFAQAKWNDTLSSNESQSALAGLKENAIEEAEKLSGTPGSPSNWEQSPQDASEIGFAVYPQRLVQAKLEAFASLDYDSQRQKMGESQYGFYLKIEQGATVFQAGMDSNSSQSYSTQRVVEYNGKPARLYLKLYERQ